MGATGTVSELGGSEAELDSVLAGTVFLKPCHFKVWSCAPGECVLKMPFHAELERPGRRP